MRIIRSAVVFLITCGFAFLAVAPCRRTRMKIGSRTPCCCISAIPAGGRRTTMRMRVWTMMPRPRCWPRGIATTQPLTMGRRIEKCALLSQAYVRTGDDRFKAAALRGIRFMLEAQSAHGGWPQRYPEPKGYAKHITFNDGAMIGVMTVLRDIAAAKAPYEFVDDETRMRSAAAVDKGIECILKCQIVVDGTKTVWCAQHDEKTLAPARARSYELPSLSGGESVRIVRFLMQIEDPDREIVEAVEAAIAWYEESKLHGIRLVRKEDPTTPGRFDKVVIEDPEAPPMWARFCQIGTNQPIFCSRDGIPRQRLADISYERRNGYSWLGILRPGSAGERLPGLACKYRRSRIRDRDRGRRRRRRQPERFLRNRLPTSGPGFPQDCIEVQRETGAGEDRKASGQSAVRRREAVGAAIRQLLRQHRLRRGQEPVPVVVGPFHR